MRELGPVSIAVCNYQGEAHLPHCLDALLALRGAVREILVVDNASTDGSLALLAERYPRVRVVHAGGNLGPARARNLALREAASPWVLLVDNDAVLAADVLERLAAVAAREGEAVIVQPRSVFDAEPTRVHYDGGAFHYAGLISLRNFYAPLAGARPAGADGAIDCAVSVAMLVDRAALLAAGGFDERMFILFEDLDLCYRLRTEGKGIFTVDDAICRHRGGTPGISFRSGPRYPSSRVFYHSRNRWLFLEKCYRRRTLLAALPGLLAYECYWFAFCLLGGHVRPWWAGKRAWWRLRPSTRELRAQVAVRRRRDDAQLLVAGPLTTTPALAAAPLRRGLLALLDFVLASWWTVLGRRLSG